MPDDDQGREGAIEFVFRFLWVRRPLAFLLVGKAQDELLERRLVEHMEAKYDRMGYVVQKASAIPGVGLPKEDGLTYFVGEIKGEAFPWPSLVRPRRESGDSNKETEGGPDEGPSKGIPESERLNLPVTQEIMERVARFMRGD